MSPTTSKFMVPPFYQGGRRLRYSPIDITQRSGPPRVTFDSTRSATGRVRCSAESGPEVTWLSRFASRTKNVPLTAASDHCHEHLRDREESLGKPGNLSV